METLKERIKLFTVVFQVGMTSFILLSVSLAAYINSNKDLEHLDFLSAIQVVVILISFTIAFFSILRADRITNELEYLEKNQKSI